MPTLTKKELQLMDEYFRVLNYLSAAQLYLLDNPLLRRKLTMNDIKPNVVGHWGTTPGQNFIYMHLNRVIKKYNLDKYIYFSLLSISLLLSEDLLDLLDDLLLLDFSDFLSSSSSFFSSSLSFGYLSGFNSLSLSSSN